MRLGGAIIVALLCLAAPMVLCQNVSSPVQNGTKRLTGEFLLDLGAEHKNPLLQLVGEAFIQAHAALMLQVEEREQEIFADTAFPDNATFLSHVCDLIECSPWSEWSNCTTGKFLFGMVKRTRQCGFTNPLCKYVNIEQRTESQSLVCMKGGRMMQPAVPACTASGYELIDKKYCLKYVSSTMSRSSAQSDCRNDGAHLINVDTPDKDAALQKLLRDHSVGSSVIWLNGMRDDKYSPWEFTYGRQQLLSTDWSKWSSGEPSGGSSELCMVEEGSDRVWWDRECYNSYGHVCEIARGTA